MFFHHIIESIYREDISLCFALSFQDHPAKREGLSKSDCPKSLMERNLARHKAGHDEST
jgi:hypothetical protein